MDVDGMQEGGEPGLGGRAGRRVQPCEVGWQGDPALCPDPATLAWAPSGPVPSPGAPRFLRRRHRYSEPVRPPTSAPLAAPASPPHPPPPEPHPAAPAGPPTSIGRPAYRD